MNRPAESLCEASGGVLPPPDQAAALRKNFALRGKKSAGFRPERIIAVGSGKGGVGKSNIALNLGIELAGRGYLTYLFDADLGTANANILAGLTPRLSLTHLVKKGRSLEEIVIEGPGGLRIIPGAMGNASVANLTADERRLLCENLGRMKERADFLIVDVGAGISQNVVSFMEKADEALVVVTPEPTSMADAYGLIKALAERESPANISVVVNRAASITEAKVTADRMAATAMQYLEQPVAWGGFLLEDRVVPEAVRARRPFSAFSRSTFAARSIGLVADRLENREVDFEAERFPEGTGSRLKRIWERIFH